MLLTVTEALSCFGRTMSKLLTIDQASEYLGISKLTLYGWVSARKLGFIKVGRLVKFKQEHLDRWIDQHTIKARPAAQERLEDHSEHG
jgi:excisionase family DNA binding protein